MKTLDPEESFKLMAEGLVCTDCGDPKVVMIGMPKDDEGFIPVSSIGQTAWCEKCALLRITKIQGSA